ncbi:hypothetical protein [Mucilaginibacter psychrotolerans]|uniref:hypothetical protein n=1 Tax=Mucilaginibacter psychrotolerans TaxID=1524096 RepID=UPI001F01081B|nr:hypothetical protein [Mucilaginibacter psychrotolerans]
MDYKKADPAELKTGKAHIIVEIIEYVPNSVVIKTIIRKSTGSISIMPFDSGEGHNSVDNLHNSH